MLYDPGTFFLGEQLVSSQKAKIVCGGTSGQKVSHQSSLDPTGNSLEGSLRETMEEVNENALYCNEGCFKVLSFI